MNSIDDREIIGLLYEASQVGVEVVLLVRGMFSLVTEIPKISNKIFAAGIIDRFLEHTRMMIFANNGDPKVFITSADLMVRNIDRRVEATLPVYDKKIKKTIIDIFEIHRKDNVAARLLDRKLSNKFVQKGNKKIRAQIEVYNYLTK